MLGNGRYSAVAWSACATYAAYRPANSATTGTRVSAKAAPMTKPAADDCLATRSRGRLSGTRGNS